MRAKNENGQVKSFWNIIGNVECVPQSVCFLGAKATQWSYLRGESVNQEN